MDIVHDQRALWGKEREGEVRGERSEGKERGFFSTSLGMLCHPFFPAGRGERCPQKLRELP